MDQDQFMRLMDVLGRIDARLAKLERPAVASNGGLPLGRLSVAPNPSTASALADMPALTDVPVVPQLPPLLDVLEDVQIEGAAVLPEVKQSLEQISATVGSLKKASASISPSPSKVPDVKTTMDSTSADVTASLDKL